MGRKGPHEQMFAAWGAKAVQLGGGHEKLARSGRPAPLKLMTQAPADAATPVVSAFYDRFPYPGDPLEDGPPPGYNWRWCVDTALAFCTGSLPARGPAAEPLRILDAGCGTGVSSD